MNRNATQERVHSSKEIIFETPPTQLVFDTVARSSITDQLECFKRPLSRIKKITIQVGGGKLFLKSV